MIGYINSTDTGTGTEHTLSTPVTKVAAQTARASTEGLTYVVEGSIDGNYWATVLSPSTFATTGTTIETSTGNFVVDHLRVNVSVNGSTSGTTPTITLEAV